MALLASLLLLTASPSIPEYPEETPIHSFVDQSLCFVTSALLESASLLSSAIHAIFQLTPWKSTFGKECLLAKEIFKIGADHSFSQIVKKKHEPYAAWLRNKEMLARVAAVSDEEKELLAFLKERWLAKTTGCYPFLIEWMCPSFDIFLQAHPDTTNSYARDPHGKTSQTYKNKVAFWKKSLPHPKHFPLILTRPFSVKDYLPFYFEIPQDFEKIKSTTPFIVVDVTHVLSTMPQEKWLDKWHNLEKQFFKNDLDRIICIEQVSQKNIGGIRILPFSSTSKKVLKNQYEFLLNWISKFGLTATRVELDRLIDSPLAPEKEQNLNFTATQVDEWISFLNSIEDHWKSSHAQKTLMFKGTVEILKDFCAALTLETWGKIQKSKTLSSVAELTFTKIKEQLSLLVQKDEKNSFYDTMLHLEQVHADLSTLIEIFTPFTTQDFPAIFQKHLSHIPKHLKQFTHYAVHNSAMSTLAGILKILKKSSLRQPCVLYGENTYFECIYVLEYAAEASLVLNAPEKKWEETDLILAQFNPALKRIDFKALEYHVERISDTLHKALDARKGKPLTLALDCTLDFSNSPRVEKLLGEFSPYIENGDLNIICYRSGSKFDLFGMDNYYGAPFFMIHNKDPKWSIFDTLLSDPVLQTDRLSLNWFCLAFQHASPYLELYRKQIFQNTRAVLNKIPSKLFNTTNPSYRVIPIEQDTDPSFIDIKVFGLFHAFRGSLLVGVLFTIKCMEAGHPLLYRPSLGFYHPNVAVLYGKEFTTVRLTLGLDPSQIDPILKCMEKISELNDS